MSKNGSPLKWPPCSCLWYNQAMIRPSRARFLMEERPEPLAVSLPLPDADAFELYRRLAVSGRLSFLLDSGKGGEEIARWSFMGSDPYLVLTGKGSGYTLCSRDRMTSHVGSPFTALADLMRASRMPRPEGLPPFFGGAVGYLSYDAVRQFERLPSLATDDLLAPDIQFAFVDLLAALDHQERTLHLIFAPPMERLLGEPREKLYREGCDRLAELEARLSVPARALDAPTPGACAIAPGQSQAEYMARVGQVQDYIRTGDIYQANLSHRFTIDLARNRSEAEQGTFLYRRLRQVNPSPFAGLLAFDDLCLVSSSPERLIRLQDRQVDTRPIAGTRPRGQSLAEDRRLAEELLTNQKERAEHLMLVDLERNDLGRVCRYGTVRADELMVVERYSHVSHIVSNVTGELREGLDGFDLIPAVFPGGTITGVPKIRCMEIIEELEPVRRGPYTGSLGYLSWSGDLDLNIIIRTLVLTKGRGYLQVGAGIVADSDPAREYEETLFKAEALFKALGADS
ncbi:MAG: anthranilate synthase component I family protein [Nitrospirae bacterium]|nr:MAG: anthranilate synthase component I family protein [Nitrospirota bacterium]